MAARWRLNILLCMPNRTKRILFVGLLRGVRPRQRLRLARTRVLNARRAVLADAAPPPEALVAALLDAYNRSQAPQWLVPALAGLPRSTARDLFPRLVALEAPAFSRAIRHLLMRSAPGGDAPRRGVGCGLA
jgi:hypothetical protein